jgi:hypothetical protein
VSAFPPPSPKFPTPSPFWWEPWEQWEHHHETRLEPGFLVPRTKNPRFPRRTRWEPGGETEKPPVSTSEPRGNRRNLVVGTKKDSSKAAYRGGFPQFPRFPLKMDIV